MSMVRGVETGGRRRKSRDALTSRPEIERLLDAACAPASPRELAGEQAAVDLFARAHLVTSPVATASQRSSRAGFKAAAAGVLGVAVFSSGVSFAATGHVPFAGTMKKVTRAVTGQSSDDSAHADRSHRGGTDRATPSGPKAAALQGLCQAYARGKKADQGTSHQTRPAQELVTAAGGADQVKAFCSSLPVKAHQGSTDVAHPSKPAHPTHPAHPAEGPTTQPTGPGANEGSNGNHGTGNNGNDPTKPTHPPKPTQTGKPSDHPTTGNGNGNAHEATHRPSHTAKPTQVS
jgi:hypothetical protein